MATTASKSASIMQAIIARLKTIQVANGYDFDINDVLVNGQTVDMNDLPAICLFSGTTELKIVNGCNLAWEKVVQLDLLLKVSPKGDGLEGECAVDDLYRALFEKEDGRAPKPGQADERNLNGLVSRIELAGIEITPREDGNRVIGVSMAIGLEYITTLTSIA